MGGSSYLCGMNCLHPTYRNVGSPSKLVLTPCGGCVACKRKRAAAWAFRLEQETKVAQGNIAAIVLTYKDECLTYSDHGPTLVKRDCQLFFKRLRYFLPKGHGKIRYFLSGEYGSDNNRPHYHLILFNSPGEKIVQAAWNMGNVNYRRYRGASWIGYILKYISDPESKGKSYGKQKCFQLHSSHLGRNYLTEASVNWHLADLCNRVYAPLKDGKKAPLHRYYKDKIYSRAEKEQIADYWRLKAIDDMLAEYLEAEAESTTFVRKKKELAAAVYQRQKFKSSKKTVL